MVVPLAVQEVAMAVWLIVKGFCDVSEHDLVPAAPARLTASR